MENASLLSPRANPLLIGHEEAETLFLRDWRSGKLAHGWILCGTQGIGKATLAYRLARQLLSGQEGALAGDHPVFRRIVAGSHADLLVIEPVFNDKKGEYASELSIEQARSLGQFLSLTAGEGAWRVVIIDPADALNLNAANAILKLLEEPPPRTVLFLISHNPGQLLPTIRSRCRLLRLHPPGEHQFEAVMQHLGQTIPPSELSALAVLASHSPGLALEMKEQGAPALYADMVKLLSALPALNAMEIHAFAECVGSGKVHGQWRLFTQMALRLFERAAKYAIGIREKPLCEGEAAVLTALATLHHAQALAEKWQQTADQFHLAQRLHLDYKQVILTFFHAIPSHEAFDLNAA